MLSTITKYNYVLFLLLMVGSLSFTSCGGSKPVVVEPVVDDRPTWVKSRPMTNAYYIGIGISSKHRPENDHAQNAKNNALNDLASEISVHINSNSFLLSLEREYKFEEEYKSNIKATINQNLEGYEIVDTWENDEEYWVYYRLSKTKYAEDKQKKKDDAMRLAVDLYGKAETAKSNNDISGAFSFYFKSLMSIKEHWNEVNEVDYNGGKIFIDNEIYSNMQNLLREMQLVPDKKTIVLDQNSNYQSDLSIRATLKGQNVKQLPLKAQYLTKSGTFEKTVLTDGNGLVSFHIANINTKMSQKDMVVSVDFSKLIGADAEQGIVKPIIASFTAAERHIPIKIKLPAVYVESEEQNLNEATGNTKLGDVVKSEFTKNGYVITEDRKKADLIVKVKANTRKGNDANNFHVAYLDMSIAIYNAKSNAIILKETKNDVKGVQLTYAKAGDEAYKKAVSEVRRKVMPSMMRSLQ